MTEYKIGDRLSGIVTGVHGDDDFPYTGEYRGEGVTGWPRVYGDDGAGRYLDPSKPITVVEGPSKLSFVGPEPEPAEAPAITLPFRVKDHQLTDSRGFYVGGIGADGTYPDEDRELAELIRDLLNKHFGVG